MNNDHKHPHISSSFLFLSNVVKPYIPYDVVPSQYVLPMATSADGTALPARLLEVPDWVVDADIPMLPVVIPADVLQSLEEGLSAKSRIKRTSCQSVSDAVELITQVRLCIFARLLLLFVDLTQLSRHRCCARISAVCTRAEARPARWTAHLVPRAWWWPAVRTSAVWTTWTLSSPPRRREFLCPRWYSIENKFDVILNYSLDFKPRSSYISNTLNLSTGVSVEIRKFGYILSNIATKAFLSLSSQGVGECSSGKLQVASR